MSFLKVSDIQVKVEKFLLKNISFELEKGQILAILGPSGAGKTLLLETIAGFYIPNSGQIYLDGQNISTLPVEKREIGFMFQDFALFPHWTVKENILSPIKFAKKYKKTNLNPEEIIKMLHIESLLDRYPSNLSGGEKQRVALARSLITNPKMFLFDEPMSALDARTREELREELLQILKKLSLSAIYVTHDHVEAFTLGDLVGIIKDGNLIQVGEKNQIFRRPNSKFVANFVGIENLFSANVQFTENTSHDLSLIMAKFDQLTFEIHSKERVMAEERVLLCIRPEDVIFVDESERGDYNLKNVINLEVVDVVQIDFFYKIFLRGDISLKAISLKDTIKRYKIKIGEKVYVYIDPESIHIIKD